MGVGKGEWTVTGYGTKCGRQAGVTLKQGNTDHTPKDLGTKAKGLL